MKFEIWNFWKNILVLVFVMPFFSLIHGMGNNTVKEMPIRTVIPQIKDGEYLKRCAYVNGEKTDDFYQVIRVHKNDDTIEFFSYDRKSYLKNAVPDNYSNYSTLHGFINMKTGSILYYRFQEPDTNKKGLIAEEYKVPENSDEISYTADFWDGYNIKKSSIRIKIRKGYPLWDVTQFLLFGPRFMDVQSRGIAYVCKPDTIKEAVPMAFVPLKKEILETPAGRFDTIKFIFVLADPFLAKLMEPYTRELTIWVEDAPRSLVLQVRDPYGNMSVVEEISNVIRSK